MPTFYDPVADAGDAYEALRGLAHASRTFDHPADMYGVIGDVLGGVRALRQVLDQLADAHAGMHGLATDDHLDATVGSKAALATADELHQTASLIVQAETRLDVASAAAGRIAWQPSADVAASRGSVHRWVSVVFMQGEEADHVLDVIDRQGEDTALEYLKGWDFGDETTDAAMENGHVYDQTPHGDLDREFDDGNYRLTYSHAHGHVALHRNHRIEAADRIDPSTRHGLPLATFGRATHNQAAGLGRRAEHAASAAASASKQGASGSWFTHPGVAAVKRERGLWL